MPIPYHGPTSAQFAPRLGNVYADETIIPLQSTGYAYQVPHITYVVQSGDTLAEVTKRLYGSNTPDNRRKVRNAGFYPGSVIHAPALTESTGNDNGYVASL